MSVSIQAADLHAIAARPRPGIKRSIPITDSVTALAQQLERMLLDRTLNKDTRIREAVLICCDAKHARRSQPT